MGIRKLTWKRCNLQFKKTKRIILKKTLQNFIYVKVASLSEYLDNAGVVSEIKKGESTMNPVKSDPPAKSDPGTDIVI